MEEKSFLYYLVQGIVRILEGLLSVGGIAGLIAIIITIAMCKRYMIDGDQQFPEIMKYALTTILGFYFGAGISRAAKARHQSDNSN
jgi:hypothetical protein